MITEAALESFVDDPTLTVQHSFDTEVQIEAEDRMAIGYMDSNHVFLYTYDDSVRGWALQDAIEVDGEVAETIIWEWVSE